jgi:hypothetical protein
MSREPVWKDRECVKKRLLFRRQFRHRGGVQGGGERNQVAFGCEAERASESELGTTGVELGLHGCRAEVELPI